MERAARNGWFESLVLLFAEKVILAAVVPSLVLLVVNPMRFDAHQQASAAIAIIAIGYFVAHTIQHRSNPTQTAPAPTAGIGSLPTTSHANDSAAAPAATMPSPAPLAGQSSADKTSPERKTEAIRPNPKLANHDENADKEAPVPEPPQKPSAKIEQTNPVNSPAIIGDHATVNYGPPKPFILSGGDQRKAQEVLRGISAPTALHLICIGRGCQSAESLLAAFTGTSWQISRTIIGMYVGVGGVDLGTGVHIMTKDADGDAFRVLKSALESISVKYEVAPWMPPGGAPPTASLILAIGNPE